MTAETQTTNTEMTAKTQSPSLRRVRAVLTRDLYKRLTVQAAREEAAPNAVVVRALAYYLDHAEKQP
jgi:hypothetical protein